MVDLEMNPLDKQYQQEKVLCGREVIEIGAVILDEEYQEIGSFKTLVKPEFNDVIKPYYENLTGITTAMVANAPVFEEALHMFISWCYNINDNIQIYQWSESDLNQIIREIALKGIQLKPKEMKLFTDWEDFQKEYGSKLQLSNAVSLKNAVMYAGVDFEGTEHDALFDARNTATLLKIVRTPVLCKKALDHVIEAMTPTTFGTTLGDLFDFTELGITA